MTFSITMEVVALLITFLLILFHYEGQSRHDKQYYLFSACLLLSAAAIGLDILTSLTIDGTIQIALTANYALNMVYFFFQHLSFSVMAIYCFYLMFEHIADKHCYDIATTIIKVFCIILQLMLLTNPWTDWFFYFEDAVYYRGPYNKLAYVFLVIEISMLCMCFYRNRTVVSRSMYKLIRVGPPMVLAMVAMQLLYQNTLLAGTMEAMVNLIFYITFQNNRVGEDSLTGLPNRNTFFQELSVKLTRTEHLHLVLIHLNRMEQINQKYGTRNGDTLLYQVSRYLDQVAPRYQAFRFGNTRFLLMGPLVNNSDPNTLVAQIQQRFAEPWTAVSKDCYCEANYAHMVVQSEPSDKNEIDENHIIDQLEYTLQQSMNKSGDAVFFDNTMYEQFERRIYVLEQIRRALDNKSFEIYFQLIYHCRKQTFTSAETLLRLFDENGNPISPDEFIPLAEQNGLIDEISWLVLEKVSTFLSKHPDLPLNSISINMTMQQLTDRTFWNRIQEAQECYRYSLDKLRIEITERTISENQELVQQIMQYLAKKGLRFYLDDFGIGYSNLANMMSLPFETVKLDSSLLHDFTENETNCHTIELLIQMLHHAGFLVVAEGLETVAQIEKAQQLNVDCIQGFYYAKPMPEQDLMAFLNANK